MNRREHLRDLSAAHEAIWVDRLHGWLASPEHIAEAFSSEGFQLRGTRTWFISEIPAILRRVSVTASNLSGGTGGHV